LSVDASEPDFVIYVARHVYPISGRVGIDCHMCGKNEGEQEKISNGTHPLEKLGNPTKKIIRKPSNGKNTRFVEIL